MDSDGGNRCSHRLGFPIRKSPDHRLLASPRSLSQLATSFFACLRQGIHTHALSSLTIKSTSHTTLPSTSPPPFSRNEANFGLCRRYFFALTYLCIVNARQYSIVKDRTAKSLVGLGRIELPTSPLSGVRSSQLSYRPVLRWTLVELVGIEPATS